MANDNNSSNANSQNGGEPTLEELIQKNRESSSVEELKNLNEQVFARLKKTEEKLKGGQGNPTTPSTTTPAGSGAPANAGAAGAGAPTDDAPITYAEGLALQEQGYGPAAIVAIAKAAKELGVTVAKAMANPIMAAGIKAQLRSTAGREGTPPPSGRIGTIPDYSTNEAYQGAKTPAERLKVVTDDARATFERRVQGKGQGGEE